MTAQDHDKDLTFHIGHDELVIRRRYEALSIANDVVMALWFLVGSVLFFSPSMSTAANWCFLIGSIEFLIRPAIRLTRLFHLRRIGSTGLGSSSDF